MTNAILAELTDDGAGRLSYRGARSVCHLTRGVLEALGGAVLAGRPRVTETACAAMGASACRFEAKAT